MSPYTGRMLVRMMLRRRSGETRETRMFDHHHLLKHGVAGQGVVTSHKEIAHDQFGAELALAC